MREASQRLNSEGRARSAAGAGRVRARADRGGGRPALAVRTLLEAEAARLAVAGRSAPASPRREELCAEGERAVAAADDVDGAVARNARFHAEVMEPAGDAVLAEPAAQVDRRVRSYCTPVARRRGRQSRIGHRQLIAAITARE
ncbi:hypothetical protein GCM10020295_13720 [Streptomyces cinereospinus]